MACFSYSSSLIEGHTYMYSYTKNRLRYYLRTASIIQGISSLRLCMSPRIYNLQSFLIINAWCLPYSKAEVTGLEKILRAIRFELLRGRGEWNGKIRRPPPTLGCPTRTKCLSSPTTPTYFTRPPATFYFLHECPPHIFIFCLQSPPPRISNGIALGGLYLTPAWWFRK